MHRLFSLTTTLLFAVFSISLTGICQASNGKIDACKLISAAQASKILGSKIKARAMDTSAAGPNAASMCSYSSMHINDGVMLIAGHIKYSNAAREVKAQQKIAASHIPPGIPKPSFTSVKGIGEAAYLYKTPGAFQLHVLAHGYSIVINRNVAANNKVINQAKQLARLALKRL